MEASARIETQSADQWVDAVWSTYGSLDVTLDSAAPFAGAIVSHELGQLRAVEVQATPLEFRRTEPMIRRDPFDELIVCTVSAGQVLVVQDGRQCVLGRGEFAVVESARPYSVLFTQPSRVLDFVWTRETIGLSEDESRDVTAHAFTAESPVGRWLSPVLTGLLETATDMSHAGRSKIASGLGHLMVAAVLEARQPREVDARMRQRYEEMVAHIERNLDAPDLGAESLAQTFFISTRTVHRIFASYGMSVAATIRNQRLEACSRLMLSRSHQDKSLGYIASQYGFTNASAFSRAFTARYGVGPNDYRRTGA